MPNAYCLRNVDAYAWAWPVRVSVPDAYAWAQASACVRGSAGVIGDEGARCLGLFLHFVGHERGIVTCIQCNANKFQP